MVVTRVGVSDPTGVISGQVFMDVDGDGRRDTEDLGLGGVVVTLDANGDGTTDGLTTTAADGTYTFSAVPDGNHKVAATPPGGYAASTPNPTAVAVGKGVVIEPAAPAGADSKTPEGVTGTLPSSRDIGLRPTSGIGGRVVFADATPELDYPGLGGVALSLTPAGSDTPTRVTTTNAQGYYFFDNVTDGQYTVFVSAPAGSKVLNTPLGGSGWPVTVAGSVVTGKNFGVTYPGSVTGRLFLDVDGDGVRDDGERAVRPGSVKVAFQGAAGASAVTWAANDDGTFTIAGLPDGKHTLTITPPGGLSAAAGNKVTVTVANGTATLADIALRMTGGSSLAVGDASGGGAVVYTFGTSDKGALVASPGKALAAAPTGTRVVLADVTGDGTDDLITANGVSAVPVIRIFDGATQKELVANGVLVFEAKFQGGVNLAAGDFNGDGKADLVVTADTGGGPRVRVLDSARLLAGKSADQSSLADFLGIADPNFRGGSRAAVGDLNADGVVDLVVAAGAGGGPRVAVFDGKSVAVGWPNRLVDDFFVFESRLRNGAVVGVGDVNGDGKFDLIASAGPGGAPRVTVMTGGDVLAGKAADSHRIADFFVSGDTRSRAGSRITVKDVDRDGLADVIATSGGKAFVFTGKAMTTAANSPVDGGVLTPFASNGLFVG